MRYNFLKYHKEGKIKMTKKLLYLLFMGILASGCLFTFNDFLREPKGKNEKPGAVIFCSVANKGMYMTREDEIEFVKKTGNGFVPVKLPALHAEVDKKKEKNIIHLSDYCRVYTGLEVGAEYALKKTRFDYEVAVGTSSTTTVTNTGSSTSSKTIREWRHSYLNFDPQKSFAALPIRVEAGKIKFLGVYNITYDKNWNATLERTDGVGYYANAYVYKGSKSPENAELRQLEWLYLRHKNNENSYWKPIIEKRLAELNN